MDVAGAIKRHPLGKWVGVALIVVSLLALPFVLAQAGTAWVRITNLAILFVLLSLGLNIVVGFAGLLDLGYIAFYAVGAYAYALLASPHFNLHLPWWVILPIGAAVACIFGVLLGLKAFSAAVLGGIGNLAGAVLGGILMGLIEALGAGYVGDFTNVCVLDRFLPGFDEVCKASPESSLFGSNYKDVYAFIVLILVLVFRPQGLLGERVGDRA